MIEVPKFLAHLRRDRRGLPVPYINQWGLTMDTAKLSIRPDGWVRRPGVFYDDSAFTEPDFRHQHMARQRECMARGLCQVCGREVPWSRRHLVIAPMTVERITFAGRQVPVVFEPWLDERCATFALRYCPALIRRTRDEALTMVAVTKPAQTHMLVSTGWVEGHLEAESKAAAPALFVKLALLHFDIHHAPEPAQPEAQPAGIEAP